MKISKQLLIILNIVLTVSTIIVVGSVKNINSETVVSQYYSPDSIYERQFFPTDLELSVLTHLNYGPFGLTKHCNVVSTDKYADYEIRYPGITTPGNLGAFAELKKRHSHLKVLISVGGIQNSRHFSMCAKSRSNRMQMIHDITKLLKKYRFDGVDYDLEFHANKFSGHTDDYLNFTHLLRETRQHFEKVFDRKMLITITGSIEKHTIMQMRNVMDELVEVVDHVNLMTFGYGKEMLSRNTHLNAPLFNEQESESDELNISYTIKLYTRMGLPTNKMVLGLAAYGRGWTGTDGLYQKAYGLIDGTVEKGVLSFTDIQDNYLNKDEWEQNNIAGVPYLYNMSRRTLISYDDEKSVALKTRFALEKGLRGVFLFQASDDVRNNLIQTVRRTINRSKHYKAFRGDM